MPQIMERLKYLLLNNKIAKLIEILAVFIVAGFIIFIFLEPGPDNLINNQIVLWVANILMLIMVWLGIKIRGESWESLGLGLKKQSLKSILKTVLRSLLVFIIAMTGFIIGSIIMANIVGIPEGANMSNYSFLKDNFGMLLLMLAGVYIVSSFGEEVIYRGFLITRFSQFGTVTKTSKILAVILSAIIFGFAHYSWGPMGIVQTFFMGLALGFCYIYMKRNLWVLILAHAYMDTILMVQMYLASN
ncbi:MAG: CPBP family intramembrane metalloprotease [Flavobacteriaceae bacterium]|nr:CPBP family intramembrane metalloprotease [Bacteroidia bacterium]MBT8288617.1 CPBP family intramembrane metalloprotease [Bacteroidia bacterium]NNF74463.1 CPBP family intramembrane metalloprotease [Flavobacteriaceae bacterium]NNK74352.1 CPBP family intramembrane metalloprotease [Flavobacteriaceae bacterium]NNL80229.1 CPBP family intramembrane metalloprotease [Flavobacteriaceae bacterium]